MAFHKFFNIPDAGVLISRILDQELELIGVIISIGVSAADLFSSSFKDPL